VGGTDVIVGAARVTFWGALASAAVSKFRCFHDGARSLFLSAAVSVDPERRYWPSGLTALFRLWRTRIPPRGRHLLPIAQGKANFMLRENEPEMPEINTDKVCFVGENP
jgi:hypothetical protein